MNKLIGILIATFILSSCNSKKETRIEPRKVSGIYPHLAMYNSQGECGTGAVVPWANRLWAITYSPHYPHGSDDKLYEITPDLKQIVREESLGGTPANRMIHFESKQLFIGPYAIDEDRNVRGIPYTKMQGRHTGNARHLFNSANKIYYATMEEGFYEVDVNTLEPALLYPDGNKERNKGRHPASATLPGAHGKGLYSGQGVLVYSNNGERSDAAMKEFDATSGVLAEWDGKEWNVARRNQFVEVTGPGGIYGNKTPETDPIWATGWDHKSLILGVRNPKTGWDFYRLPKASHSYDGAHGWNTEWPRIRDVGTKEKPDYLMTMHGMFWKFPGRFTTENSAGIRPRSAYLKVIGDFTRWNNKLVFGCDDSAQKEFLNKRKQKGGIEGPGQSNSNLWFTSLDKPDQLGPNTASGAIWLNEKIDQAEHSEPMLFSGWEKRTAWIQNHENTDVEFIFEVDKKGNDVYSKLLGVKLEANESRWVEFTEDMQGEWIRCFSDRPTTATVSFNYSNPDIRSERPESMFDGLATVNESRVKGGLLYGLGGNRRALGTSAVQFENGQATETGYYELDEKLNLLAKDDAKTNSFIKEKFAIPENVIEVQESSVLIIDDKNRRWRLPLGDSNFKTLTNNAQTRICREVATERDLLNCCGTFYELPAENADGFAKIRPVSSHNFRIHDYASYRGLLVMTGLNTDAEEGEHVIVSDDKKTAVWVGTIDDLWDLGKPTGHGGPWINSSIEAGVASDSYLISHYDNRTLKISHESDETVTFKIEVEPIGHGPWMLFKEVILKPQETFNYTFPDSFQARWIRFTCNKDCVATTFLQYN